MRSGVILDMHGGTREYFIEASRGAQYTLRMAQMRTRRFWIPSYAMLKQIRVLRLNKYCLKLNEYYCCPTSLSITLLIILLISLQLFCRQV
jgi:hypothetical protein